MTNGCIFQVGFLVTLMSGISALMSVTAIALVEFISYWTDKETQSSSPAIQRYIVLSGCTYL